MEKEITIKNILERYPVNKLLRLYTLPAILNMLVIALYNIADRIFIGQGAGANAICGLALTLPCITLISSVGTLTGIGAASGITSALTTGDYKKAERIMGNALFLNLIVSCVTVWLGLKFLEPLLYNFGGSANTVPYAKDYLEIMIPACIINNINLTFNNTVRIAEKRRKFMTIMLVGPIINLILDPIFIFRLDLGIAGAAWASLISMMGPLTLIILHFHGKNTKMELHKVNFKPDGRIMFYIIMTGMAAFIMNITTAMVNIIINRHLLREGGDYAIGAYGIINTVLFLVMGILQGICQGMQPILNYNYGKCHPERVRAVLLKAIKYATLITSACFILFEIFSESFMKAFTTDQELIRIGSEGLRLYILMLPVTGLQIVGISFFQSVKQPLKAIVMNISRQFLFLIPALVLLSNKFSLTGIWLATPSVDALVTLIVALFLFHALKCDKAIRKDIGKPRYPVS